MEFLDFILIQLHICSALFNNLSKCLLLDEIIFFFFVIDKIIEYLLNFDSNYLCTLII